MTSDFRARETFIVAILLVLALGIGVCGAQVYRRIDELRRARRARVHADLEQMKASLQIYQARNGFYPSTEQGLRALVQKPATEPEPRHWLQLDDQVPRDPWGREYVYRHPGQHNPKEYDLFSAGPDGNPETEKDNIGNWESATK